MLFIAFLILLAGTVVRAEVLSPESLPDRQPRLDQFYRYTDPNFPAFNNVFNLWVSAGVEADWDSLLIADFIEQVMNEDSTDTDDVFPQIWEYFCFGDQDSSLAGVRFTINRKEYTKIDVFLSHQEDAHPECIEKALCRGGGFYRGGTNEIYLSMSAGPWGGPYTVRSTGDIANSALAHELQHLASAASQRGWRGFPEEAFSMAAEYMCAGWRWHIRGGDVSYDASIWDTEDCDQRLKYFVWLPWVGYFLERTRLDERDITDDAIYKWRRAPVVYLRALAAVLDGDEYAHLEGESGNERLKYLFADYAVAKFANAPDFGPSSRFGFESTFSPRDHSGMFHKVSDHYEWCDLDGDEVPETPPCPEEPVDCPFDLDNTAPCGCGAADWHVRIVPPNYELGPAHENTTTLVSGIYTDGDDTLDPADGDGSHDYIDVATYGTDYIIFRAGDYYHDGAAHEFRFSFTGASPAPPPNTEVFAWAIGYGSEVGYSAARDTLYADASTIVFIDPIPVRGLGAKGEVVVTDFGASVKSVVIVIALAEKVATWKGSIAYFSYRYQYGVRTPATWKPESYALAAAYPNPFNPAVRIVYDVPRPGGRVQIAVYDVSGRKVTTLVDGSEEPGRQAVEWSGRDDGTPSGVYFVRMEAPGFTATRKIVLIK